MLGFRFDAKVEPFARQVECPAAPVPCLIGIDREESRDTWARTDLEHRGTAPHGDITVPPQQQLQHLAAVQARCRIEQLGDLRARHRHAELTVGLRRLLRNRVSGPAQPGHAAYAASANLTSRGRTVVDRPRLTCRSDGLNSRRDRWLTECLGGRRNQFQSKTNTKRITSATATANKEATTPVVAVAPRVIRIHFIEGRTGGRGGRSRHSDAALVDPRGRLVRRANRPNPAATPAAPHRPLPAWRRSVIPYNRSGRSPSSTRAGRAYLRRFRSHWKLHGSVIPRSGTTSN